MPTVHQRRQRREAVDTKPPSTTGVRHEHDPHQNFLINVEEQQLNVTKRCFPGCSSVVAVEPVWLCDGDCRGRARDVDVPVTQIQAQTVEVAKEIPQEIDVEKPDVGSDFKQYPNGANPQRVGVRP